MTKLTINLDISADLAVNRRDENGGSVEAGRE